VKFIKRAKGRADPRHCASGRSWLQAGAVLGLAVFPGCAGAPSINLLGSFFPGWMLCMILGVVGCLVLRQIFIKTNIEPHLHPRPLVYFCLWLLIMLGLWVPFFRS
jgi:protein AaeX